MPSENKTAYAILGLLCHEPMSGYDIKKRIQHSIARFWDAGYGQIYPSLRHLTEQGLVTVATGGGAGRPDKKVYSITEQGRAQLISWLSEPSATEYVRYEILLKLFFGNWIGVDRNVEMIKQFRARYQRELGELQAATRNLRQVLPESPDHLYFLLTAMFGARVYQAYLDWADDAVNLLQPSSGSRPGEIKGGALS